MKMETTREYVERTGKMKRLVERLCGERLALYDRRIGL